jgi:hypothetical protein
MEWDLGIRGIGLLFAMSIGFGAVVGLVTWFFAPRWLGVLAAVAYFAGGLFVSEVWFGWANEDDLQPNIDGLSFDEVLLLAPLLAIGTLLVAWVINAVRSRARVHSPT